MSEQNIVNVSLVVEVAIAIKDRSVIDRCVNNEDGWRDHFYDLETEQDVLNHLAYNCVSNGIERANRLDGWADLPDSAATMRVMAIKPE